MTKNEKMEAMLNRDSSYDGKFYIAVKTTHIVCLPSCPAKPLPKNVVFFDTLNAALEEGYRPCKRCKPDFQPKDDCKE